MVLIKQNIKDHHDQKTQLFTSAVKINIDSLLFCYKTSSLTFLGRVAICEKEPWVTLSLLTTWCKMHEGHLAPCFRKVWHVKDTALCLLFLCINLGSNTFKCIPFLHFTCLLHNFFLMPAKHYYMQISCKASGETKRLPKKKGRLNPFVTAQICSNGHIFFREIKAGWNILKTLRGEVIQLYSMF